jgi:dTDP-4-dehydrorhamnose 3,5-epimerase
MLDVRPLALPGLLEIRPAQFADERGFFSETWNAAEWKAAGIDLAFVQDNHSLSRQRGVLRGLHFQAPPGAQAKLVRVTRGAAYDVAVDLRSSSATYRQWAGLVLSAQDWNQLLLPEGFAHGFLALEPGTEVQYRTTAPYHPALDRAIAHDDPTIGIDWPLPAGERVLSDRDRAAPRLAEVETGF